MDPLLQKLLESSGSYTELLRRFQEAVESAIRQDGFVGRLDLCAGARHELALTPGRLDLDDGPLDVVQPVFRGRELVETA